MDSIAQLPSNVAKGIGQRIGRRLRNDVAEQNVLPASVNLNQQLLLVLQEGQSARRANGPIQVENLDVGHLDDSFSAASRIVADVIVQIFFIFVGLLIQSMQSMKRVHHGRSSVDGGTIRAPADSWRAGRAGRTRRSRLASLASLATQLAHCCLVQFRRIQRWSRWSSQAGLTGRSRRTRCTLNSGQLGLYRTWLTKSYRLSYRMSSVASFAFLTLISRWPYWSWGYHDLSAVAANSSDDAGRPRHAWQSAIALFALARQASATGRAWSSVHARITHVSLVT